MGESVIPYVFVFLVGDADFSADPCNFAQEDLGAQSECGDAVLEFWVADLPFKVLELNLLFEDGEA